MEENCFSAGKRSNSITPSEKSTPFNMTNPSPSTIFIAPPEPAPIDAPPEPPPPRPPPRRPPRARPPRPPTRRHKFHRPRLELPILRAKRNHLSHDNTVKKNKTDQK